MSALELPVDVLHEIFTNINDFATLYAAVRVSKKFNDAFKSHPKSLIRTVLINVVGPAFFSAARLAEYQVKDDPHEFYIADQTTTFDFSRLTTEDHYRSLGWVPKSDVAESLQESQEHVRVLERFYSQRHKDRTSTESMLEPSESMRFQRAIYRYWLDLDIAAFRVEIYDCEDESSDDPDGEPMWKALRTGATKLFKNLPTDELLELLAVASFCEETHKWVSAAYYMSVNSIFSAPTFTLHPAALALRLENRLDLSQDVNREDWHAQRCAVEKILGSRGIKLEDISKMSAQAIVKNVNGARDPCSRCGSVCGVELVGTPNASMLAGTLAFHEKWALLPGLLPRNRDEKARLKDYIAQHSTSELDLLLELMDTAPADDDEGTQGQHVWSKDNWYCLDCVKELFRQRFLSWWREKKSNNGGPVQDQCWYGYNCRTMTHRPAHASKLDHLCAPTRGEATQQPAQQ